MDGKFYTTEKSDLIIRVHEVLWESETQLEAVISLIYKRLGGFAEGYRKYVMQKANIAHWQEVDSEELKQLMKGWR